MTEQEQTDQNYINTDNEIDLRQFISTLWNRKWLIIGVTSLFAFLSIIVTLQIPNEYKSTTMLAPTQGSSGSLTSVTSQISGIASLAGINIPKGATNETQMAQEIMKSWSFIEKFIDENNLAEELSAVEGWDMATNKLIFNEDIYDVKQAKWVGSKKPTSWQLYKLFSNRLSIIQNSVTGMISLSIEYYSPVVAQQWVELFVESINEHMRLRKLNQSNVNIEYLQQQISKTSIAEMKIVFYEIIEEQTKGKMLAEASREYVFVTVNKAMVPEVKSKPVRSITVLAITLLGGIISSLYVLILGYMRPGIN